MFFLSQCNFISNEVASFHCSITDFLTMSKYRLSFFSPANNSFTLFILCCPCKLLHFSTWRVSYTSNTQVSYDNDHFSWKSLNSVEISSFWHQHFGAMKVPKSLTFKAGDVIFFFVYSGCRTGLCTDFSGPLWWRRVIESLADPLRKNVGGSWRGVHDALRGMTRYNQATYTCYTCSAPV